MIFKCIICVPFSCFVFPLFVLPHLGSLAAGSVARFSRRAAQGLALPPMDCCSARELGVHLARCLRDAISTAMMRQQPQGGHSAAVGAGAGLGLSATALAGAGLEEKAPQMLQPKLVSARLPGIASLSGLFTWHSIFLSLIFHSNMFLFICEFLFELLNRGFVLRDGDAASRAKQQHPAAAR